MNLNTSALERIKTGAETKVAPVVAEYAEGMVLAWDQSLAATGWAFVSYDWDGLRATTGMISAKDIGTRFADSMPYTAVLFESMREVLQRYPTAKVVHEAPAIGMRNSDSSVMAATTLRLACHVERRTVEWMPSRQSYYKTITGNGKAPKSEMTVAVRNLFPEGWTGPANGNTRDAIGLGVAYLRSNP